MAAPVQTLSVNGVELCVQAMGATADPTILLIGGMSAAMDWWEDGFCARLVDGGRRVVRYDHRDTGGSTSWPDGAPGYTGADLVADAAGVLDALGVAAAHVVGVSMGGALGQVLAAERPGRVASLTLVDTSAALSRGADAPALPPPAERVGRLFTDPPPDPDFGDRDAVVEWMLAAERCYAGEIPVDEGRYRALAARVVGRTRDMAACLHNHAVLGDDPPATVTLADITAPTVVLHGTADPLFPPAHGVALAAAIPGARLVELPGGGHQYPPPVLWDIVVREILALSGAADAG